MARSHRWMAFRLLAAFRIAFQPVHDETEQWIVFRFLMLRIRMSSRLLVMIFRMDSLSTCSSISQPIIFKIFSFGTLRTILQKRDTFTRLIFVAAGELSVETRSESIFGSKDRRIIFSSSSWLSDWKLSWKALIDSQLIAQSHKRSRLTDGRMFLMKILESSWKLNDVTKFV